MSEDREATARIEAAAAEASCAHASVQPTFDYEASKGLSAYEVRKRWPRFMGTCPDCNKPWILYASFEHYVSGDW